MMSLVPRIVLKPAFSLVGFSCQSSQLDGNFELLWGELADRFDEIPFVDPDFGYGAHLQQGSGWQYLAGLAVLRPGLVPDGMTLHHFDAHTYAVFAHRGRLHRLSKTIAAIFRDSLPDAGFKVIDGFYFEFFDDRYQPESEDSVVFIYVPVETH